MEEVVMTTKDVPRRDVREAPGHAESADSEEFVRGDEFQCARCGMFVARIRMGDPWLRLCRSCATYVSPTEAAE